MKKRIGHLLVSPQVGNAEDNMRNPPKFFEGIHSKSMNLLTKAIVEGIMEKEFEFL